MTYSLSGPVLVCVAGRDGRRLEFVQEDRSKHHRIQSAAHGKSHLPTPRRRRRLSDPEKNSGIS